MTNLIDQHRDDVATLCRRAAERIARFTAGKSFTEFDADRS